jgi:hypothetical protein
VYRLYALAEHIEVFVSGEDTDGARAKGVDHGGTLH